MAVAIATDVRDQAVALRQTGLGYKTVARKVGISPSTVRRFTDAEYAERQRRLSREAKRRRTGICVDCGGLTRYNGTNGQDVSKRCASCQIAYQIEHRAWTEETVVLAIQRFAAENGRPPTATEWIKADPDNGYPSRGSCYRSTPTSVAAGFTPTPRGKYERTPETLAKLSAALSGRRAA